MWVNNDDRIVKTFLSRNSSDSLKGGFDIINSVDGKD